MKNSRYRWGLKGLFLWGLLLWLLPSFQSVKVVGIFDFGIPFGARKVFHYDEEKKKGYMAEKSYRRAWRDFVEYWKVMAMILRGHDEMMERYLELSHTSDSHAEDYETAELLEKVKQLLAQRKKPAQEVVWMRAQGYTFAEIAKAVGISESSARTLDFRTKHWLKEQLGLL